MFSESSDLKTTTNTLTLTVKHPNVTWHHGWESFTNSNQRWSAQTRIWLLTPAHWWPVISACTLTELRGKGWRSHHYKQVLLCQFDWFAIDQTQWWLRGHRGLPRSWLVLIAFNLFLSFRRTRTMKMPPWSRNYSLKTSSRASRMPSGRVIPLWKICTRYLDRNLFGKFKWLTFY